jgi:membrane protein
MALSSRLVGGAGVVSYGIDFIVSLGVITVLFAMIFKILPDVRIDWADVWLGAVITAVLFKIGQYALAIYFRYGSTTSAYGAAGSFVAVLLWAYYSAQILFFGAEFTQVYMRSKGKQILPSARAMRVSEQDRAQRGTPGHKAAPALTMASASSSPTGRSAPSRRWSTAPPSGGITRPALLAGSGLAAGLVAGVLGARQQSKSNGRASVRHAAAIDLDYRLDRLNQRLDRIASASRRVGLDAEPRPSIWEQFREGFEEGNR